MREILCFGDSNTYGLIPGTKERYKENIRWTGILQQKLKEKDCRIVEEGLCGRTTVFEDELRKNRKGSDLLPVLLESHAPIDQVVLMLGTNDCKSYYHASAEVIGLGVEKLIGQIRQAGEHIKILLVSPILLGEKVWEPEYDPEFDEQSVETSRQLKTVYSRIAKSMELISLQHRMLQNQAAGTESIWTRKAIADLQKQSMKDLQDKEMRRSRYRERTDSF